MLSTSGLFSGLSMTIGVLACSSRMHNGLSKGQELGTQGWNTHYSWLVLRDSLSGVLCWDGQALYHEPVKTGGAATHSSKIFQ